MLNMKRSLLKLRAKIRNVFPVKMPRDWDEAAYLCANPDVKTAVETGLVSSGFEHWQRRGLSEGRRPAQRTFRLTQDFSQYGEQAIILDYFSNCSAYFEQYCVDAGAYDGMVGSNSRALFLNGWRGVVIEPNPRTFARLRELYSDRSDVTCIQTALSDRRLDNVPMKLAIGPEGTAEEDKWKYAQVSTLHDAFAASYEKEFGYVYETFTINTDTLTHILQDVQAPRDIGFLSIDCEGEDINLLRELDLNMFRPRLICVEADDNNRHVYAEILEPRGYVLHSHTVANAFFRATC